MDIEKIDPTAFRTALGQFPTGVTIITTLDDQGNRIGVTASSFNTVSLDPPLVLWSIDKAAYGYDSFVNCKHFAIHVLSAEQAELSDLFAQTGADKFDQIQCTTGRAKLPILPEFAACFECDIEHRYAGGDHTILVGRVKAFKSHDAEPLLFHRGRYGEIA